MDILEDGIIGINEKGEIFACNKQAEEITKASASLIIGKRCDEVFSYIPFVKCLLEKRRIPAKMLKINGVNVSMEVVPVLRQENCIGAFAKLQKFNEVEVRQNELRSQLMSKGHVAKYSFDDVIGESEVIQKTKKVLERMAASESPVLLIGETGTGKELFAHAVHRASRRKDGPFIAINVAAVPENLLESELFGYEEGAFTGAKKGGRPGLFEFSHRGTLFLDEVEGMSQALQVKLLRVLQEREIMRVGGNRVIKIDVRIVAATNESLEEKVEEGSFRRDLYYRLNTLPIVIPTLAERGEDIFLIIESMRQELGGNFVLTEPVKEFLRSYTWPGNIRELRNIVEYFIYTGEPEITIEELPPTVFRKHSVKLRPITTSQPTPARTIPRASEEFSPYWFVLGQLYQASENNTPIGRERILTEAKANHLPLSQQEVRKILSGMADEGLLHISRGRGGSRLLPAGRDLWETHNKKEAN